MNSYINFRPIAEEYLAAEPTANLYMLLDHAGLPGLRQQLSGKSVEWVSLFDGTKEENALSVAPILMLIGSDSRLRASPSLFDWMGKNGTYTSSVILLSSQLETAVLKRRLAVRLDVKLSENMGAMLRFFDPRVFESLTKILSAEQATIFFSPAEAWWYVDRAGQLLGYSTEFEIKDRFSPPLMLSQEQEFALLDVSEVDQVLYLLRKNIPGLMMRVPLSDQYEWVDTKVRAARLEGVDSVLNFVLYAAVLLSQGERFIKEPLWKRFLDELRQNRTDFPEEMSMIDFNLSWEAHEY